MEHLRVVSQLLFDWYHKNQRKLPWREKRDPYQIWLSEIMLQQTTIKVVIPYFERFLDRFPTLECLAKSSLQDVIEQWSGLGYYSRARNIHKTAKLFYENGYIPTNYKELISYPGLGPYTSRAISSIAFEEKVGVLDGNVIRLISRLNNLQLQWWQAKERGELQSYADRLNQYDFPSSTINQALMELGATVCTPQSPNCDDCPLNSLCLAKKYKTISDIPLKKPKPKSENWLWQPQIILKDNKVLLEKNTILPFLKNQWLFPGEAKVILKIPERYHFKHHITRYNIFVQLSEKPFNDDNQASGLKSFHLSELKRLTPSSLITKCLKPYL